MNNGILLRRGAKSILEEKNILLLKYQICVELPDEWSKATREELLGKKFKYKMGDGIHNWNELPYEDQTIPVSFYC